MAKTEKNKVGYVDGYVLVVPKDKVPEYRKIAKEAGAFWMKHGALSLKECIGNDLSPDMGGYAFLTFPKMVRLKPHETVWFSYIEYRSKTHRDSVNKKVEEEMQKAQKNDPNHMEKMPFDMRKMAFGGFKVEAGMSQA
jgi:uncharacterized protein YbaA (DUF1428 family)